MQFSGWAWLASDCRETMVYKRDDGTNQVSASIPDALADELEAVVEEQEEISEGQIIREGLRRQLQEYQE